jgi:hypothetical protein
MIEPFIYAGTGFLLGGFLFVGFIPMAHAYAVRLTQRRLATMTPISMAEINAGKNRLRAEFAISTRRLEVSLERMSAEFTGRLATLAKKGEAVIRLRLDYGKAVAAALAGEVRRKAAADRLASAKSELAGSAWSLQAAEHGLADTSAALVKVASDLRESAMMASCGRIELVVLRARREVLEGQVERHELETNDLRRRIEVETVMGAAADHALAEERSKADALSARIAERKRELVVRSIETEILTRRVQELERRLEEQPSVPATRESASDAAEPATVRRVETPAISGRVGADAAALASRERSLLLVTFRKALAGGWSRSRRSRERDGAPKQRVAVGG